MRLHIVHELDAPLDAVELALLSTEFAGLLLAALPIFSSIETIKHELNGTEFRRVLRFQAKAPLPGFNQKKVTRDMLSWEEDSVYRLGEHVSTWNVLPREPWRKYVRSVGTYRLEALPSGLTRRTVEGSIKVFLPVFGPVVERMALGEIRKAYDAEAGALRKLATL